MEEPMSDLETTAAPDAATAQQEPGELPAGPDAAGAEAPIAQPGGDLAGLQAELARKDEQIQQLQAQNESQSRSLASLQASLQGKEVEIRDLTDKLADLNGQFQRLGADLDNVRRRNEQERDNLVKFAGERVITNLLPIFDNFGRAMKAAMAIDTQALVKGVEAMAGQVKGLDMIRRQLDDLMQKSGVAPIPTVGQAFDPNYHEAVMLEETTEHPDQTIMMELQTGYTLSGKVLRAAMVKVASNPHGTPPPAAAPAELQPEAGPPAEPPPDGADTQA